MDNIPINPRNHNRGGRPPRTPKEGEFDWALDAEFELRLNYRLTRFTMEDLRRLYETGDSDLADRIVEEKRKGIISRPAMMVSVHLTKRPMTREDLTGLRDLRKFLIEATDRLIQQAANEPLVAARSLMRAGLLKRGIEWVDERIIELNLPSNRPKSEAAQRADFSGS